MIYDHCTGKKQDYNKYRFTGSQSELCDLFLKKVAKMAGHLFNFKWQGAQFEMIWSNLQPGAVLMVMDFAQNFEHKHTVELQSSHWHHQQTTIHPVVCYYSCPACQKLCKEELIMLSSDKTHDAFAVKAFKDTALQYLESNSVLVKCVI